MRKLGKVICETEDDATLAALGPPIPILA